MKKILLTTTAILLATIFSIGTAKAADCVDEDGKVGSSCSYRMINGVRVLYDIRYGDGTYTTYTYNKNTLSEKTVYENNKQKSWYYYLNGELRNKGEYVYDAYGTQTFFYYSYNDTNDPSRSTLGYVITTYSNGSSTFQDATSQYEADEEGYITKVIYYDSSDSSKILSIEEYDPETGQTTAVSLYDLQGNSFTYDSDGTLTARTSTFVDADTGITLKRSCDASGCTAESTEGSTVDSEGKLISKSYYESDTGIFLDCAARPTDACFQFLVDLDICVNINTCSPEYYGDVDITAYVGIPSLLEAYQKNPTYQGCISGTLSLTTEEYNSDGNITQKTKYDTDGTTVISQETYAYDSDGDLISQISYDANGNPVSTENYALKIYTAEQAYAATGKGNNNKVTIRFK